MSTSSLRKNSARLDEIETVAPVVEAHLEELRRCALGKRFRLSGVRFALLKADRNVLYRVRRAGVWFLKMPSRRDSDAITREATGFRCASDALMGDAGYRMPRAVMWSEKDAYLMTAEIAGQPLNRFFYCAAVWLKRQPLMQVRTAFARVGRSLARFHLAAPLAETVATNRRIDQLAVKWPAKGCAPDAVVEAALAVVRQRLSLVPDAVIHGNMQMENVMAEHSGVTFIDFENCGLGSRYEDLSVLCSQLLLTETLLWFPPRVSHEAMTALLDGYSANGECGMDALHTCVGARLIEYYLGFVAAKGARVAGVPVSAAKLERLLSDFAAGRFRLPQ
jgi:aminoglycoside phosphotransferase